MNHQPPSFLPLRNLGDKRPLHFLTPYPQQMRVGKTRIQLFERRVGCRARGGAASQGVADALAADLQKIVRLPLALAAAAGFVCDLSLAEIDPPAGI